MQNHMQIKVNDVNVKIIATFCYNSKRNRQPQYSDWKQYSLDTVTVQD